MKDNLTVQVFERQLPPLPKEDVFPNLIVRLFVAARNCSIIVLDDDPTGTQTVHGVSVLTEWSQQVIERELEDRTPLFFIMTNSRSMTAAVARELAHTIGTNIGLASKATGRDTLIISRSDSTLRGHYPVEVEGLLQASGDTGAIRFIIPAFFEGGRITVKDVHYVREKDQMIPAAQTPYAKDTVFGYHSSDLKKYVEEKTEGAVKAEEVFSLSLQELRSQSLDALFAKIQSFPPGSTCVVNAAHPQDLRAFVVALLGSGVSAICRTAASFVSAIAALPPKALLDPKELTQQQGRGKLIVLGSHVPKSTAQLNHLLTFPSLKAIELQLNDLLFASDRQEKISQIIKEVNGYLNQDETVLIYTQRILLKAETDQENLSISERVSALICEIVSGIKEAPRIIIAKGGITSSDVATRSLGIKKALVLGQVFAGVPVWEAGEESRFPGVPYVVFPGNVGEEDTISKVVFPS